MRNEKSKTFQRASNTKFRFCLHSAIPLLLSLSLSHSLCPNLFTCMRVRVSVHEYIMKTLHTRQLSTTRGSPKQQQKDSTLLSYSPPPLHFSHFPIPLCSPLCQSLSLSISLSFPFATLTLKISFAFASFQRVNT